MPVCADLVEMRGMEGVEMKGMEGVGSRLHVELRLRPQET